MQFCDLGEGDRTFGRSYFPLPMKVSLKKLLRRKPSEHLPIRMAIENILFHACNFLWFLRLFQVKINSDNSRDGER